MCEVSGVIVVVPAGYTYGTFLLLLGHCCGVVAHTYAMMNEYELVPLL